VIHDAPQPSPKPVRKYEAPTLQEIYKWIAQTPLPRDKALLAILLRIDAHLVENTEAKRGGGGLLGGTSANDPKPKLTNIA
jgi:hypothetical protein